MQLFGPVTLIYNNSKYIEISFFVFFLAIYLFVIFVFLSGKQAFRS